MSYSLKNCIIGILCIFSLSFTILNSNKNTLEIATVLYDKGKYDSAILYSDKAIGYFYDKQDYSNYLKSLNIKSSSLLELSKYDSAFIVIQKTLKDTLLLKKRDSPEIANAFNNLGSFYICKGNLDKAYKYFQKALKIQLKKKKKANNSDVITTYNNIGRYFSEKGEFQNTIAYNKKALEISDNQLGQNHSKSSICLNNIGNALQSLGKYKEALSYLEKALSTRIKVSGNNHPEISTIYNNIGLCYVRLGKYNDALQYYQEDLNVITRTVGFYNSKTSSTYGSIGFCLSKQGLYDSALLAHQKSLEIRLEISGKKHPETGICYNNVALCLKKLGNYKEALTFYKKALKIRLESIKSEDLKVAYIYNNIGMCFEALKMYSDAFPYFQKALTIIKKFLGENHYTTTIILNNIGLCLSHQKKFKQALNIHLKVLKVRMKILEKDHPYIAVTYTNIGSCFSELEMIDSALYYSFKALRIRENGIIGKSSPLTATSYNNISGHYIKKEDYHNALNYLNKALKIREKTLGKNHPQYSLSLFNKGVIYEKMKLSKRSLKLYQKAIVSLTNNFIDTNMLSLPNLNHISSKTLLFKCLNAKSNLLLSTSDTKKEYLNTALNTSLLASKLIDSIKFELGRDNLFSINQSIKDSYEAGIQSAYTLFHLTNDSSYINTAFSLAERSKAFFMQKALRETNASKFANVPDSIIQLEDQLKLQIAFYRKQLNISTSKRDSIKITKYQNYLFTKKSNLDSLIDYVENQYPKYFQLKYQISEPSLQQIQNAIPDSNTCILEYFVNQNCIFLFTISKKNVSITTIDADSTLYQNINSLIEVVSENNPNNFKSLKQLSYSICKKLLPNIDILEVSNGAVPRLVIVPDGILHYLPFEMLNTDAHQYTSYDQLPFLIKKFSIAYDLSANLWAEKNNKTKSINYKKQCLALAPSYRNSQSPNNDVFRNNTSYNDLSSLIGARNEVENLSKVFSGNFLLEKKATETNFKKLVEDHQIIHLAMHGSINDQNPEYSNLLFYPSKDSIQDDSLHVYEIYNMNIPAELVVLSACQTGDGKLEQGEGIVSIARAFMYAGSSSVVLSLWKASDANTEHIMKFFYTELGKGVEKDLALRNAKIKYIQSSDQVLANPFFWANFIHMGNIEEVSSQNQKLSKVVLWLLISLIVGISIMILFSKPLKDMLNIVKQKP